MEKMLTVLLNLSQKNSEKAFTWSMFVDDRPVPERCSIMLIPWLLQILFIITLKNTTHPCFFLFLLLLSNRPFWICSHSPTRTLHTYRQWPHSSFPAQLHWRCWPPWEWRREYAAGSWWHQIWGECLRPLPHQSPEERGETRRANSYSAHIKPCSAHVTMLCPLSFLSMSHFCAQIRGPFCENI